MLQTILGVAVLLVGLAGILFSERLVGLYRDFIQWAFGLKTSFVSGGDRAGFILGSLAFFIMGLLIALHVIPK